MPPHKTADKDKGGVEATMREQAEDNAEIYLGQRSDWLRWPGRHPGIVLLGTLIVAMLAFRKSPPADDAQLDTTAEGVPLFI